MRLLLVWVALFAKSSATRVQLESADENNPLTRPFQRTATQAVTEFVSARWAQLEARLPVAAQNLFRGNGPPRIAPEVAEFTAAIGKPVPSAPSTLWIPKMPKKQPLPFGRAPTAATGNAAHSAFRAPFVRAFRALERAQRLGKYRYSTVRPMGRSIFPKRYDLPKSLHPTWQRYFSSASSESRAKFFGRHLRDILARKDVKEAKLMQQGKGGGVCTGAQRKAFASRFGYYLGGGPVKSLSYQHPSSKLTSLYLITSDAADHNGAFKGLDRGTGARSFGSMCYRLLQMSSHYNVVFKRVDSVKAATEFVESLKSHSVFGQGIKHVTIGGHGNPTQLVLGSDSLFTGQVGMKTSQTSKLLDALRPMLIEQGEARSTVFLESCSTGKQPNNMNLKPLAQNIADSLPGVEVHAFKESIAPALIKLQGGFFEDALFKCTVNSANGCLRSTTFISKAISAASFMERVERIMENSTEDPEEFTFYDGVTFLATVEMCAEWCSMVSDCNSLEFTELELEDWIESPLGLCSLYERDTADEEMDPYEERLKSFTVDDVPLITEFDGLELD